MNKTWKLIALATALTAGSAYAQVPSSGSVTPAGTVITNVAEIIFTPEPSTPGETPPETTVPSNPVTTTVLPVPSFTITPNDGSTDVTKPNYAQPSQSQQAKPCDTNVSFLYFLTNTGNVTGESYTLTNTPDPTGAVKVPTNIRYYLDANKNSELDATEMATPITTINNVAMGQSVQFFQVYDIPCTATGTDTFGGDPTGTRNPQTDPILNPATPLPQDANNSNTVTIVREDGVVIGPKSDPDGNGNPVTPAYQSPEGVGIAPTATDSQVATITTLPTTAVQVTFTNTLQNTGNRTDTFEITKPANTFPASTTITIVGADGNPLPDADNDGNPEVVNVPAGGTADIRVIVTLPAGTTATQLANRPEVTIVATSQNDGTKTDPTKDIVEVKVPGLSFGDPTPTLGGDPAILGTPPVGTLGNPATPVVPGNPATCTAPIRTFIPMEIANTGSMDDSYTVTGTAPVTVLYADGTVNPNQVTVPVAYYRDVNGNGALDTGDTPLVNNNTGVIKAGEEVKLVAVVDVPCAAAKQVITLDQNAVSNTDPNLKVPDTNDTITVGNNGEKPTITKAVDLSQARPGEELTYTIIGKNTTNANITKAMVCDSVPENTTFTGATVNTNFAGNVLLQVDGKGWTTGAAFNPALVNPGTAAAKGSRICVGIDTNNDGDITTADILKPGETITVTFKVRIN